MGHLSFFALFYFLVALVLIVIYVLFVFLFFLVVQTAEEEAVLVVRSVNDDQVEVVAAIAA